MHLSFHHHEEVLFEMILAILKRDLKAVPELTRKVGKQTAKKKLMIKQRLMK